MSTSKVYIDGQAGSTGLEIQALLGARDDVELLRIPDADRKSADARAEFLNKADLAILCLPDAASAEALTLLDDSAGTRVIDASTARRLHPDWVYGLPELDPAQRDAITTAPRVANPGCFPVTFLLGVRPLIEAGLLDAKTPFTVHAVSGYSGGGRAMVDAFADAPPAARDGDARWPLGLYALSGGHKHLPEMHRFSLASAPPLFVPSVAHTYNGMLVSVPLTTAHLNGATQADILTVWRERYANEPFVKVIAPEEAKEKMRAGNFLELTGCNGTNRIELYALGDEAQGAIIVGRLDNLGKGASGNAVQLMNIMLGFEETKGLVA